MALAQTVMASMADMTVAVVDDVEADRRQPLRELGSNTIGHRHTRKG